MHFYLCDIQSITIIQSRFVHKTTTIMKLLFCDWHLITVHSVPYCSATGYLLERNEYLNRRQLAAKRITTSILLQNKAKKK